MTYEMRAPLGHITTSPTFSNGGPHYLVFIDLYGELPLSHKHRKPSIERDVTERNAAQSLWNCAQPQASLSHSDWWRRRPPTPTRGLLWVCCDPLGRLGTQFGNRGVKAHLDSWLFYNLVSMEIFGLKSIQLTYKWLVCDSNDCCPCQFPCLHTNRK